MKAWLLRIMGLYFCFIALVNGVYFITGEAGLPTKAIIIPVLMAIWGVYLLTRSAKAFAKQRENKETQDA